MDAVQIRLEALRLSASLAREGQWNNFMHRVDAVLIGALLFEALLTKDENGALADFPPTIAELNAGGAPNE